MVLVQIRRVLTGQKLVFRKEVAKGGVGRCAIDSKGQKSMSAWMLGRVGFEPGGR